MIGSFEFNGIDSESFKLVCKSVKRPLLPPAKTKRVELPGSSGIYDYDDFEYGMRQVTMRMAYIGRSYQELRSRARSLAAWLSAEGWSKLIINDELDKYYLAKISSGIELESLWESGSADVAFDCQPFALSVTPEKVTISEGLNKFTNPGTRRIDFRSPQGSVFTITVTGSWTSLSFDMNGKKLSYVTPGSGTLVVDNVNMNVTLNGENRYGSLSGDVDSFLTIRPGENALTVNGSNSVSVDYIPLWY